jgi:hypothetical protein
MKIGYSVAVSARAISMIFFQTSVVSIRSILFRDNSSSSNVLSETGMTFDFVHTKTRSPDAPSSRFP